MPDNRELAGLILLTALAIWGLSKPSVRQSLGSIGRLAIAPRISVPIVLMLTYVWALTRWGSRLGLWQTGLLSGTIVWLVTVAFVTVFNLNRAISERRYLTSVFLGTIGIVAALEFIAGLSTFDLWVEILLQVFFAVVAMIAVVGQHRTEHRAVAGCANTLLGLGGLVLVGFSIVQLTREWDSLDHGLLAREALLPVWMTAGFLPFAWALALYAAYELPTKRIVSANEATRWQRLRALLALASAFRGRRYRLRGFGLYEAREMATADTFSASRATALNLIRRAEEREADQLRREDRLRRYAGVAGTDSEGRQLDRREFEATTRALTFLWTCHAGHYRKDGRYREDMLGIAELGGFDGLPDDHGIIMELTPDGQSWWAYRRTVTGWCFAIGASMEPPDEWRVDGAEPPTGPPGLGEGWGAGPHDLEAEKNW